MTSLIHAPTAPSLTVLPPAFPPPSHAIARPFRDSLIFGVVSVALMGIGLTGGAILLRQLRTQLYVEQAESARRNAEAMAHLLERDVQSGLSAGEVIGRLQAATIGMGAETEFLCLLDDKGVLLSHPNPSMLGMSKANILVSPIGKSAAAPSTVGAVLHQSRPSAGLLAARADAAVQVVYYQPVKGTPWTLAAHENAEAVAQRIGALGWELAGIAVPTVVVMALVGTVLVRTMSRRYERRIEAANAELERRVAERTKQLSDLIVELRAAHEQLIQGDKMHLLGELMSGIAHEINNPLTVLHGYAHLFAGHHRDPEVQRQGVAMAKSAERVRSIVENLLAFARQQPPVRRRSSLTALIQRAVDLIGADLRHAGIALVTELPDHLEPLLLDEQQLEQVLLNLLNNSRQALATHDGERGIRLTVAETAHEIVVTVADTGPGLKPEVSAKLFQPFITTKPTGNGLGLSLCRRFVEAHGGHIEAVAVAHGARFVIRLPRATPAAALERSAA